MDFLINDKGIDDRAVRATPGRETSRSGMEGAVRAAKLLLALGPERAAGVLKEMDASDIEHLVNEMTRIREVPAEERNQILNEFSGRLDTMADGALGGLEAASEILRRSFGDEKADEILSRVNRRDLQQDFEFLEQVEPAALASALSQEHPQVAAVAMSCIKPRVAALALRHFEPALRSEVARRIARTAKTNPDAIIRVAQSLREKFEKRTEEIYSETGGADILAGILNYMDRATEDTILEVLDKDSPALYSEVKEHLYTFEELVGLEITEMRLLLSRVNDDFLLAASLRGVGEDLRRHFFNSISQNRAADIIEEMELRGAISVREINEARNYVLHIARKLDEEGAIVIKKGKEEYI